MQLNLDLQTNITNSYLKKDFLLLDENSAAFHFLEKFFAQKKFSQAQFSSLILRGSTKSGKTHLLKIFAQENIVEFLSIDEISSYNISSFFAADHFYILENIEEIKDEELLFHIINAAFAAKAFLILSVKDKTNFQLKDLNSRVKNIFALEIKNPSLETIKILLINAFARKQLKIPKNIIDIIVENIERSYEAVFNAVKLVEFYHQETGKKITSKEIKKIMNRF